MSPNLPRTALLTSKLVPTPLRDHWIDRPELLARLDAGLAPGCKMTLLAAPPGYGKTTLLSQWVHRWHDDVHPAQAQPVCHWLTLDATDNALPRFLTYLQAAVARPCMDVPPRAAPAPGVGPERAASDAVIDLLARLINDLSRDDRPQVLILDDYHVIAHDEVHAAVTFLVQHLPPELHLVIGTRADPPLPVARLRSLDELVELRVEDLRFSFEETTALLARALDFDIAAPDIAALTARTEGWPAGLHLVALSLARRGDPTHFIRSVSGSSRHIVGYLAQEVLACQPEHTRAFLARTSILERLSGPLCDAVTGDDDGWAMLDQLDKLNLFLIPLDTERTWFRYHSLFRDFLLHWLQRNQPERVPELHARAAEWYEQHGLTVEALHHAHIAGREAQVRRLAADTLENVPPARSDGALSEPLTEREQQVLHLLIQGLSNRQIAERLVLARSTVKWYLNAIYGKLCVSSRQEAIARTYELHLDHALRVDLSR